MTIPRKDSHELVVSGRTYRYVVRPSHIVLENVEHPGHCLEVRLGHFTGAITPKMVARAVRSATQLGWKDDTAASFGIDEFDWHSDDQGPVRWVQWEKVAPDIRRILELDGNAARVQAYLRGMWTGRTITDQAMAAATLERRSVDSAGAVARRLLNTLCDERAVAPIGRVFHLEEEDPTEVERVESRYPVRYNRYTHMPLEWDHIVVYGTTCRHCRKVIDGPHEVRFELACRALGSIKFGDGGMELTPSGEPIAWGKTG